LMKSLLFSKTGFKSISVGKALTSLKNGHSHR
jgi:hypothetical protein